MCPPPFSKEQPPTKPCLWRERLVRWFRGANSPSPATPNMNRPSEGASSRGHRTLPQGQHQGFVKVESGRSSPLDNSTSTAVDSGDRWSENSRTNDPWSDQRGHLWVASLPAKLHLLKRGMRAIDIMRHRNSSHHCFVVHGLYDSVFC